MKPRPRLRRRSHLGAGRHLRNERGAVLALMVLMLIVLLGLAALAIDLGLVCRGPG
jgi:Flp pilus assembly protein TadG